MIYITVAGADYTKYVYSGIYPTYKDTLNQSKTLTFSLVPSDNNFIVPQQGDYLRLFSDKQTIFTGFITNISKLVLLNSIVSGYNLTVESEETSFNSKQAGNIAAYVGQNAGDILISLLNIFNPGNTINTSTVNAGPLVSYFKINSTWNFTTAAQNLANSVNYRWFLLDHSLYFLPQNDTVYGYEAIQTDANFNLSNLNIAKENIGLANDVNVSANIEPQEFIQDSFLGDGTTNVFNLTNNLFGSSTNRVLFNDPFIAGVLNNNSWQLTDPKSIFQYNAFDVITNGGDGNFGVSTLTLKNAFELGGELLFDHGTFKFNELSVGIIGGIYDGGFSDKNCISGFYCTGLATYTALQPLINGQYINTTFVTQPGHSYRLQTYLSCDQVYRYRNTYTAVTARFGGDTIYSDAYITLVVLDSDLTKPSSPPQTTVLYDQKVKNLPVFGYYCLLNAAKLFCSCLSGPTVSQLPNIRVRSDSAKYFNTTINQSSDGSWSLRLQNAPANNSLVFATYRTPGIAQARLINNQSIETNGTLPVSIGAPNNTRTSEDCSNLALSYLTDHMSYLWGGTYTTQPILMNVIPQSGRFIEINVPEITPTFTSIVTSLQIQFTNLTSELMILQSTFGFSSVMNQYVVVYTQGTSTPFDWTLVPQYLDSLGSYFTPVLAGDNINTDGGRAPANNFYIYHYLNGSFKETFSFNTEIFNLPRTSRNDSFVIYEQDSGGKISRFPFIINSTGIPIIPAAPQTITAEIGLSITYTITLSNTDDVYGVEIREADDVTIFADTNFNAVNPFIFTVNNSSLNRFFLNYNYHTFNRRGEFSPATNASVQLPFPLPPIISLLGTEGQTANLSLVNDPRTDIIEEILEVATDIDFTNIIFTDDRTGKFTQSSLTLPNPGTFYARGREADVLGFGINTSPTTTFSVTSTQFALSVKSYGAKGDGHTIYDANITSGNNTLSSLTANFTINDLGKIIHVNGAGVAGGNLVSTIISFQDNQNITLTDNANTTVVNAQTYYATDDTQSVQNAIAAAEAGAHGDTAHAVFFPSGSYLLTPSSVNYSNATAVITTGITIYGEGYGSEIRLNQPDSSLSNALVCVFSVNSQNNISIHDLKFYGDQAYQFSSGGAAGVAFDVTSHCNIHNCWFENFLTYGIIFIGGDTFVINNNVLFQCGQTTPSAHGIGIYVTGASNFTVDSNKADTCGQYGFYIVDCSPYTLSNNTATNCGTDGIREDVGSIQAFPQIDGGTIQGNTLTSNIGNGITLIGNQTISTLISATRVIGNISSNNGGDGILVSYATAISIGENRCSNNGGNGIHLVNATLCKITHNNCSNNGNNATAQIFEDTGCYSNTIDNPEVDPSNIKRAGNLGITPNDAIVHEVESISTAPWLSTRVLASPPPYIIQNGDKLRFDIFVEADSPNFQYGLDFYATSGPNSIFLSTSGLVDQNGVSIAPTTDLTNWDFGRWYQRVIDLSSLQGYTITQWFSKWDLSNQISVFNGAVWTGRIGNVMIYNTINNDTTLIVYSSGTPTGTVYSESTNTIVNIYSAHISQGSVNMDFAASDGNTYLRAIQQTNYENMVQNSNFEAGAVLPPPGWIQQSNTTLSYDKVAPYAGSQSLIITAPTESGVYNNLKVALNPGDVYKVGGAFRTNSGTAYIILACYSSNNALLGEIGVINQSSSVWTVAFNQGTVPANTAYGRILCQASNGTAEFDDILCIRVRSLIDEVQMKGSVPPFITNPGFSYVGTSSSISWYWDGTNGSTAFTIYRSDGTSFTPNPDSSGKKNITAYGLYALSGNVPYNFYPYCDETDLIIKFVNATEAPGNCIGTSGHSAGQAPGIAYSSPNPRAAAAQYKAGRIPLSFGVMQGSLGGSGGGFGGSQGGGNYGSGGCPRRGMLVNSLTRGLIEIEKIVVGEQILSANNQWTTVTKITPVIDSLFARLLFNNGEELEQSISTVMPLANSHEVRSDLLTLSDIFIGREQLTTLESISLVHANDYKFVITCEPYHTFYCGRFNAGILTHNVIAKY